MIFDGLNPEQRRAVETVRGPVCILAGAGSGKTTTITRRIANQVASGSFAAGEILAVTFTDKAAAEMRARLEALGVAGVTARTFHSAALGQLHRLGRAPSRILPSKALALRRIGNGLPPPYKFRPAGDLATEVEWAKNRRLTPDTYLDGLGDHEPPIPGDLMKRVFRFYESEKAERAFVDFEDLLELAVRMFDADPHALAELRERYRAFTVDEYQDVNLLQQALLDRWLGGSDELCAVGDDYQSIYAFTGAAPQYLLGLPRRFAHATVVRLEENYRSTPQVLALANRIVPSLGGAEKILRATRAEGPEPVVRVVEDERVFVVEQVRALRASGVAYEEIAVLCRTNARLADFEEPFHEARIPFQGAALLSREAARQLLKRLRKLRPTPVVAAAVRGYAEDAGWVERPPDKLGERELVRQADLGRLVKLAAEFDDGMRTTRDFIEDLEQRFGTTGAERRGVHLLTLHGAKGLEFEAVFMPRIEEKELPIRQAKKEHEIAEERRLFYVGLTRAKRHLSVTWSGKPSRFLAELGVQARAAEPDDPVYAALKRWRLQRATADDLPAYVVFHNSTLAEIAGRRPRDLAELRVVPGVGPAKLDRYGDDVLRVVAESGQQEVEQETRVAADAAA
ncbi:MAG TPA: ATP-dependent DNA helicase UvrD2 [Gaiellaceae bacterium]|nr:ATP-dependent DNA helicase UvrD2 [Gaiellaceae bacterium]HWJ44767.1 ATP-dependent DNA helicase UvrD2 [Gaiellaceae bacterium]